MSYTVLVTTVCHAHSTSGISVSCSTAVIPFQSTVEATEALSAINRDGNPSNRSGNALKVTQTAIALFN